MKAVIDASIVIAALSPDEASEPALNRVTPFMTGGGHAPFLWPVEIANAFIFKHRRKAISLDAALDVWRVAMRLPLTLQSYSIAEIDTQVLPIALRHELTVYDSMYLHLASTLSIPLLTLDRRLGEAARAAGVNVI